MIKKMNSHIKFQLSNFLKKNDLIVKILCITENPSGFVYLIEDQTGIKRNVTIIKSEELQEIYQMGVKDLFHYLKQHTNYQQKLSIQIASPKLVRIHDSYLHSYENIIFYITEYVPGDQRSLSEITSHQKNQIAHILSKIHRTKVSTHYKNFFSIKTLFFARIWQKLLNNNGLDLIQVLAKESHNDALSPFINKVCKYVTYQSITNPIGPLILAHNDIKPKNIIWGQDGKIYLSYWDDMCMMRAETDFIDTLISWTLTKKSDHYCIDKLQAAQFKANYALPLFIHELDIFTLSAKWIFWVIFCYSKGRKSEMESGLLMLNLLKNNQDFLLNIKVNN